MNRRGFLSFVGGTAAVIGTAGVIAMPTKTAAAQDRDDFEHGGYRVKWRDYANMPNQNVTVGMWLAKHTTHDAALVSTTLGQCYPARAWEVVDMTRADGWPLLTPFSSDDERQAVKDRARAQIVAHIDAEPPMRTRKAQWAEIAAASHAARRDRSLLDASLKW